MKYRNVLIAALSFVLILSSAHNASAELVPKKDLADVLPAANVFVRKETPFGHYLGYSANGGYLVGVAYLTTEVVPNETWGYRDQIVTLVGVDIEGKITGVKVLEENETPRYTRGLLNDESWFLEQFKGKTAGDDLLLGINIDGITGATISSSSITRAIESSLELVIEKVLNGDVEKVSPFMHLVIYHFIWQINFIFLWLLLAIAFIAFIKKSRMLRYLVFGITIVYVGFLKGGGFSLVDLLNIGSLSLPVFLNNLYWYSLVIITIGLTIFAGRFYCGWLCPFGAVSEVLFGIVPVEYKVSRQADKYLKFIKYLILALIFSISFLLLNKALAIYLTSILEPFATFFKLYGDIINWFWLISILIISSLISRFYCRYFCPLGAFFAILSGLCALLKIRKLNVELPQNTCKGCKKAQKVCQMDAIFYDEVRKRPRIDTKECFLCNTCVAACPVASAAKIKKKGNE